MLRKEVLDLLPRLFPGKGGLMSSEIKQRSGFMRLIEESEVVRVRRELKGIWNVLFKVIAGAYSVTLIYSVVGGRWPSWIIRGMFLLFILVMIFMKYPARKRSPLYRPSLFDFFLIGLTIASFGNFVIDYEAMAWRAGLPNLRDLIFGLFAIVLVLEGCRRAMSVILPLLALLSLGFAYLGPYFPGILSHQGFSITQIVGDTYASMNGIFGFVTYIFAAYVMLFIIMGSLFESFGAGSFFIDLPIAITSRFRGGAAKAAVVASSFFGMISGSATANTVATGTFTIPLMKKVGYRPEVAGAIEPAASTGGMFMPPIMGAGAFLMAEMMRIPYAEVVRISIVPAILYFFSVLVMVHFEACRTGIGAIAPEDRQDPIKVFKKGWYHLVPLIILIYVILSGSTPSLAAFYAILSSALVMFVRNVLQGNFRKFLITFFEGLANGGERSLIVGSTAGPVGIMVGIALLTGLAFKFSSLVLSFTFGMKWMALILVMLATFVLGMGMTVTADYLILAILAVPAMGQMGIPLLAAHLTAFWYSQSSNVTPPVCMAAFAGAGIAGSNPYKTGLHAMRFSSYLYLMPFMFVYTPMLMLDGFSYKVVISWMTAFVSAIPFGAGAIGYLYGKLTILQRFVLIVSSLFLLHPSFLTDGIGLLLFATIALPQILKERGLISWSKK
jgi:TRAP transporter 4TM/12TM fusion protein